MAICCFVISPGRCGTQWLTHQLKLQLQDVARVEHEPIHLGYTPHINSSDQPLVEQRETILSHLESITDTLESGLSYIECGFPCWRHIRWMISELSYIDNINFKIINIVREPKDNAQSLLKINAYTPPLLPHMKTKVLLIPDSQGAHFSGLSNVWQELSSFDKALFYCCEVYKEGEVLKQQLPEHDFLRLNFEDMFCAERLAEIVVFMGEKFSPELFSGELVDNHYGHIAWHQNRNIHPDVLNILKFTFG